MHSLGFGVQKIRPRQYLGPKEALDRYLGLEIQAIISNNSPDPRIQGKYDVVL